MMLILGPLTIASVPSVTTSAITFPSYSTADLLSGSLDGQLDGSGEGSGHSQPIQYELLIEIDYMQGHAPTQSVLSYIDNYYSDRGIDVTFYVDDVVPYDPNVTSSEFWAIEAQYNDHDYGVYSKWKWVLFGTVVEDDPGVVGYIAAWGYSISWILITGKIISLDCLAGNYIFIADETGDVVATSWAVYGVEDYEVEAVVLMHEIGHSIGIMNVAKDWTFDEIYDPDLTSVMSWLNPYNCNAERRGTPYWHYSGRYWSLRNMEYYAV